MTSPLSNKSDFQPLPRIPHPQELLRLCRLLAVHQGVSEIRRNRFAKRDHVESMLGTRTVGQVVLRVVLSLAIGHDGVASRRVGYGYREIHLR